MVILPTATRDSSRRGTRINSLWDDMTANSGKSVKKQNLAWSICKLPQNTENNPLQIWAPQTRNANIPPINRPSKYKPPGDLYSEIAPYSKLNKENRSKHIKFSAFAKELLRVPNDCCQKVSHYIADCLVHSSVLAWISSVHIDRILAWLSLRKIYVIKASFSKNLLQITDINFLPTISQPNGFWDAYPPPSISLSRRALGLGMGVIPLIRGKH